jgi:SAM-dependent methyltransferase
MAPGAEIPADWYRTSLSENVDALYFERGGEAKAVLVVRMLDPEEHERILDLACATGQRTLALSRLGFDVVGADTNEELLSSAGGEAELQNLWPHFVEEDPRRLEFDREFDIVLSLGGGALEHFDYDEENLLAFAAAARALRPGGRLLMQLPNVLHVEAHLPERTWIEESETIELIEQHWHEPTRRLHGTRRSLLACEHPGESEAVPFQRRLYTVEELAEIFASVGLGLANVFDEAGQPCVPSDEQRELFVEARG